MKLVKSGGFGGDCIKTIIEIRKMLARVIFSTLLLLLTESVYSSSNPATYLLNWPEKSEQLTYRSCGCADSCWVAELRERKSKRLKAILRCDCTKLFATYPPNFVEKDLLKSCVVLNERDDKMEAISKMMERLIDEIDTGK